MWEIVSVVVWVVKDSLSEFMSALLTSLLPVLLWTEAFCMASSPGILYVRDFRLYVFTVTRYVDRP